MTISCLAVYLKLQHPIWIVSDLLSCDLKKAYYAINRRQNRHVLKY